MLPFEMHKNQANQKASTQDNNLEIKINNRTQVDKKKRGGYLEGFYLLIKVLSVNSIPFFPGQRSRVLFFRLI